MKHTTVALVALLLLSGSSVGSATPLDVGPSILVSRPVPAPSLDPTQPPVHLVPPIRTAAFDQGAEPAEEPAQAVPVKRSARPPVYERAKPSVLEKLITLERKKNAWLKRTFLGK